MEKLDTLYIDYVLKNYIKNDSDFYQKNGQIFQPLKNKQQIVTNHFIEN